MVQFIFFLIRVCNSLVSVFDAVRLPQVVCFAHPSVDRGTRVGHVQLAGELGEVNLWAKKYGLVDRAKQTVVVK